MKKMSLLLALFMALSCLTACGGKQAEPEIEDWTRQGYYTDDNGYMLSVTWMEDIDEPGWYVGCMLGEDLFEDSWGGTLAQEGNALRGELVSSGEKEPLAVSVSEEGEDGLLLVVEGGETYHFTSYDMPEASVVVTANTEGWGYIAYAEGEEVSEIDYEYPGQSVYIGLAEPATYTFTAWPQAGNMFVKWTKNGENFSAEPSITVLLDESADYIAVFEEDPDWQNPVMNFVGEYQCDRAHATVECLGYDEAWISIEWGSSARETTNWVISGRLDTDTLSIEYTGCAKTDFIYDDNGEIKSDESEYEEVPGAVVFHDDGTFTWRRDLSEPGDDMLFQWIGAAEDPA